MTDRFHLPQSELRRLYAAAPDSILGRAVSAIPDYSDTLEKLRALPPVVNAPALNAVDSTHLVDAVVGAGLRAGLDSDSSELRLAAANAHAEVVGASLVAGSVHRLRQQIGGDLDSLVYSNVDDILRTLHGELEDNLKTAGGLAEQLNGVDDFDAAERLGVIDELRAYRACEAEYEEIRSAQSVVMDKVVRERIADAPVAHVAEPVAVGVEDLLASLGVAISGGQVAVVRSNLPANWASPDGLRWCVQHPEAKPWIPTRDEFHRAQERQADQLNAARNWLGLVDKYGRRDPVPESDLPALKLAILRASQPALTA